jgi:hypothetical protein
MKHRHLLAAVLSVAAACGVARQASAQALSWRGFAEASLSFYPQPAPNDATTGVAGALVRVEPAVKAADWLRVAASFDARMDTHDQVAREWTLDWSDRGIRRPSLSVRRLSAVVSRGGLTFELGKQFVRWGKADILNPTDRFAPRDFLSVVDNDFLAVTSARATCERGGHTLDVVWVPRFTPSRIPLFDQRWTVLPPQAGLLPLVDGGARYPRGSQAGVRWNRAGAGYEFALSFYNGFNHLPLIDAATVPAPPRVVLTRVYPQMRMYGADAALPRRWFTLKGEFGYFTSATPSADEYGIYVVQIERQVGDWTLVGGYSGDFVTRHRVVPAGLPEGFNAERGFSRAFLGRVAFTIDPARSLVAEAAVRHKGAGAWLKGQYVHAWGRHLRGTVEGNWLRGDDTDFLGQFHRNSNVNLTLRYSF